MLLKRLSATECGNWDKAQIDENFREPLRKGNGSLNYMENYLHRRNKNSKIHLLKDIKEDLSKIVKVPWFYACNKNRYPSWEGRHDSRVT